MTPPRRRIAIALALFVLLLAPNGARAQSAPTRAELDAEVAADGAMVVIDGQPLFRVAGLQSLPATERAQAIAGRIGDVAADPSLSPDSLRLTEVDIGTQILLGDRSLMVATDLDAQLERLSRSQLAVLYMTRIRQAIVAHRAARTPESLLRGALFALGATLLLTLVLFFLGWLQRRLHQAMERSIKLRAHKLKIQSVRLIQPESVWSFAEGALGLVGLLATLVLTFVYLDFVLSLFPWTRALAAGLLGYVLGPARAIGAAVVGYIPSLMFLVVLGLITRLVFATLKMITTNIERGRIVLRGFDPEWAWPTYRLVRIGLMVLVLVVAFPYIPGSNSPAFQGISIFLGVLISLGSSSVVGNLIAGYTMIYWRALRVGDRVQIGDVIGEVVETRTMVTHMRTAKNEEVVIPNSAILAGKIVNYSSLARKTGLILHTTVGIGYEVPWRQVESMLLMAAGRTSGLQTEPKPFVLERALGDFAVTYEINGYTNAPHTMLATYAELHRNILDVFNEFGVQIMTPAYEGDPEVAKVVPRERWHQAPAVAPEK